MSESPSPKFELEQFDSSGTGKQSAQQSLDEVEAEKNNEMDPLYQINYYIAVSKLAKFGKQSDLHQFRQLSGLYRDIVNPKYFDLLEKTVVIGGYLKSEDEKGDEIPKGVRIAIKSSIPPSWPPYTILTSKNWDHNLCHTIRKLEIANLMYFDPNQKLNPDGLSIPELVSQISPFITTLEITMLPTIKEFSEQGYKCIEFINQFINLKLLDISYRDFSEEEEDPSSKVMEVNQLEKMIEGLKPSTNVEIKVHENYLFFRQFDSTPNTTLIFKNTRDYDDDEPEDVSGIPEFEEVVKNMELYPIQNAVELEITVFLKSLDEVKRLTDLCLHHQEKIKELYLHLNLGFQEQETTAIRHCLTQLSPIVTQMDVSHIAYTSRGRKACDILSSGSDEDGWKNLKYLYIGNYQHPLEILKKCPKLQTLCLYHVEPECIFYDKTKTDEEVIMEYFGNLPLLTLFSCGSALGDKFGIQGKAYLKKVLPEGTKIEHF